MPSSKAPSILAGHGTRTRTDDALHQEAWSLNGDARFESILIGYDAHDRVRYVTGVARANTLRYEEVIDRSAAKVQEAGSGRRYTWTVHPRPFGEPYNVIAIGPGPEFVRYLSIKAMNESEEEND